MQADLQGLLITSCFVSVNQRAIVCRPAVAKVGESTQIGELTHFSASNHDLTNGQSRYCCSLFQIACCKKNLKSGLYGLFIQYKRTNREEKWE